MKGITQRLTALEAAHKEPPPPAVRLIGEPGETTADVLARHGLTDATRPAGLLIVRTIVEPEQAP